MRGSIANFILPVLFVGVFYLLVLRPQRNRARNQQRVRSQLEVGAEVMTTAGMFARVAAVDQEEDSVLLESAPGVTARYVRAAVARVVTPAGGAPDGPPPANRPRRSPGEGDTPADENNPPA